MTSADRGEESLSIADNLRTVVRGGSPDVHVRRFFVANDFSKIMVWKEGLVSMDIFRTRRKRSNFVRKSLHMFGPNFINLLKYLTYVG